MLDDFWLIDKYFYELFLQAAKGITKCATRDYIKYDICKLQESEGSEKLVKTIQWHWKSLL